MKHRIADAILILTSILMPVAILELWVVTVVARWIWGDRDA